jgi:hypothetical protein
MNGMQYAELNPRINFNGNLQLNEVYEETPEFSKFQENVKKTKFSDFYIGGGSSAALRGLGYKNSPVSEEFFSDRNIERIQMKIKEEIYRITKGKYRMGADQDPQDLLIAMRAVYLDFNNGAKNLPTKIIHQVKVLNKNTLDYIIPDMLTNIKQYYGYLKEINEPRNIMARPINVNKSQRGTLPSITTLWR